MSEITPLGHGSAPLNRIGGLRPTPPQSDARATPAELDHVELSTVARLRGLLDELPEVREDLVDRVKGEIDAGIYEDEHKIEIVVNRLADELANL